MTSAKHTVDTLHELMDERDRRYQENRTCDQEAVKLAKEIADKAQGKVSISLLLGVASLVFAFIGLVVSLADKLK